MSVSPSNMNESTPLVKKKQSRKVQEYYRNLEELQSSYAEDDHAIEHGGVSEKEEEQTTRGDNILAKIVLACNVFLLLCKSVATYLTSGSSLSIISTLMDSIVDITSGLSLWYASYAILHTDFAKYPRGRPNLVPMAIIFVAVVMGMASCYVIFQCVLTIVDDKPPPTITLPSLSMIAITIVVKGFLWIACVKKATVSSRVLAVDQRNDVGTNIVAIGGAVASQYWAPADSIGAIIVSGYVLYSWCSVLLDNIPIMTGVAASDAQFSRVCRLLIGHSDKIRCLDTLLIYHSGEKVRVEAHVVLPPDMQTREVHDEIVDPLQRKLKCLSFVERAFVHPDYECDGYDK